MHILENLPGDLEAFSTYDLHFKHFSNSKLNEKLGNTYSPITVFPSLVTIIIQNSSSPFKSQGTIARV